MVMGTKYKGEGCAALSGCWAFAPCHEYTAYVPPIPECILGFDILQGLWLHTTAGDCVATDAIGAHYLWA